ncbi:MAG TPA: hypothetical protein VFU02_24750 [Polyangiaceae bacterium]|nr:hypothetical protein [Polyangiaceae bacterium]
MRTRATRSLLTAGVLAASVGSTGVVWAWANSVLFSATVWGHRFSEVSVESKDCTVAVRIKYDAPANAYRSRLDGMNHYRFRARARFASGAKAEGPVFGSTKAGAGLHTYNVDTGQACWGREKQSLVAVDVEGCRGATCQVEPFK